MSYFESIINSLATIWSNKLRSGLTMLGIIIGVASVVVMVAIGQGAQASVTARLQEMGTNVLFISGGGGGGMFSVMRGGGTGALQNSDYELLKDELTHVVGVAPQVSSSGQLVYGDTDSSAQILGVKPDYFELKNIETLLGSTLTEDNETNRERVIVIDEGVVEDLGLTGNFIGEKIRVSDASYTIVGEVEGDDSYVYAPFSTVQLRISGTKTINQITVFVETEDLMDTVQAQIEELLLKAHNITDSDDADFSVTNQADMLETMNEITGIFTMLLGGIAGISLVVGGIGVMNIMLVSVTERTREIGIRKAVGAHRNDILFQFLIEAMILSLLGGIIAVFLSFGAAALITKFYSSLSPEISMSSIVMAFGFSMGVGIIFGLLPAYKASKLKPIDALRYE